jgi:preprotein translocase subunit SecD
MRRNLGTKLIAIIAVLIICLFGIFGIPKGLSGKALLTSFTDRIHLGLDLRGGTHLILQVMVDDAVNAETDNTTKRIEADLQAAGITFSGVTKPDPTKHPEMLQVLGTPAERAGDVRSALTSKYSSQYDVTSGADNVWVLTMKPTQLADLQKHALQQAIETIRERIDKLGVSEPVIQEYGLGSNQILVELPGVDDPGRVKEIIQSTARLEIHHVLGGPFPDEASALQSVSGTVPPDQVMMHGNGTVTGGDSADQVWILKRISEVAGSDFRDAQPSVDENQRPDVTFILTTEAGQRFYNFTSANIGNRLGVVLDNRVREVANIQQPIRDQGRITGGFSKEQSADLSLMLRTGALPASIRYLEERTVGPSLGADSIHQGVMASIIGMAAVMIFMLIYYRGAGINADLALILNLIILLAFMGISGSTLTLPGIAGVILTIGMGVDSNVLIFERIREELRAGKAPSAAVDQGFAHAWITIIDTHVTTIVSAAILFLFGTGPVRGFAVTLTFGLLANLFTAVFVSRVIFDWHVNKHTHGESLSI